MSTTRLQKSDSDGPRLGTAEQPKQWQGSREDSHSDARHVVKTLWAGNSSRCRPVISKGLLRAIPPHNKPRGYSNIDE